MVTPSGDGAYNISMFPSMPPISIAMAGLEPAAIGLGGRAPGGERVREVIAWAAKSGVRALQVDATAAGIRPRELDRSARRDLAALLRRNELACSGVDVFIPPEHFRDGGTVDRAVSSVLGAIELAADLATLASGAVVTRMSTAQACVSVVLPSVQADAKSDRAHAHAASAREAIIAHAARHGVRIADFAWPIAESEADGRGDTLGVGLDPAVVLGAGADPSTLAAKLAARVADARLSDIKKGPGGIRTIPGAAGGSLDVVSYLIALATAGYPRHVVLDMRGLQDPAAAVRHAVRAISVPGI